MTQSAAHLLAVGCCCADSQSVAVLSAAPQATASSTAVYVSCAEAGLEGQQSGWLWLTASKPFLTGFSCSLTVVSGAVQASAVGGAFRTAALWLGCGLCWSSAACLEGSGSFVWWPTVDGSVAQMCWVAVSGRHTNLPLTAAAVFTLIKPWTGWCTDTRAVLLFPSADLLLLLTGKHT